MPYNPLQIKPMKTKKTKGSFLFLNRSLYFWNIWIINITNPTTPVEASVSNNVEWYQGVTSYTTVNAVPIPVIGEDKNAYTAALYNSILPLLNPFKSSPIKNLLIVNSTNGFI